MQLRPHTILLVCITLFALALHLFACFADPFLHFWDECFHAVVAKNMLQGPFTPRLHTIDELPLSESWARAGIWLHKPPFFLWQIALSLNIFGLEPWAVRLPSALWMTALVPMLYRMGLLMRDRRTGMIAATLIAFAYYPLELATGGLSTDHNDAIFISMICGSWWAWLEWIHQKNNRKGWVLLIGLFASAAVLTKWYVGLAVFLPWTILCITERTYREKWAAPLIALSTVIVLAGSWVLSIWIRFPELARYQWSFKADHFSQAIDGHRGDLMTHLNLIQELVPPFNWWIMIPLIILLAWRSARSEHRIFIVSTVVIIHLLFALAKTKMPGYTMVLLPIYILSIANGLNMIIGTVVKERGRDLVTAIMTIVLCYFMLDPITLNERHSTPEISVIWEQERREQCIAAIPVMADLAAIIPPPDSAIVFNIPAVHHMEFMFKYGYQAMDFLPDQEKVKELNDLGYLIVVVQDSLPIDSIPSGVHIVTDSEVNFPRIHRH